MDISILQHAYLITINNPARAGSADVDYSKTVHSMSQPFKSFRTTSFDRKPTLRSNDNTTRSSNDRSKHNTDAISTLSATVLTVDSLLGYSLSSWEGLVGTRWPRRPLAGVEDLGSAVDRESPSRLLLLPAEPKGMPRKASSC